MTIKIAIEPDLSAVDNAIHDLQQRIEGINQQLQSGAEIKIDTADADARIAALTARLADLTRQAEKARGLGQAGMPPPLVSGALPLPGQPAHDVHQMGETAKRVAATMDTLQRVLGRSITTEQAAAFNAQLMRYPRGGGLGSSFVAPFSDLEGLYSPEFEAQFSRTSEARRTRDEVVRRLAQRSGIDLDARGGGGPPGMSAGRWERLAGAAGAIAGSIATGGGDGGLFGSLGGAAGAGGGAVAGALTGNPAIGFVAGALLSSFGSALGGKLDQGIERALNEALAASGLRRSLGGLSAEFEGLTGTARSAGAGILLTSTEFLQLERQFSRTANLLPEESRGLVDEVRSAVEFGHAYGLSPEQGAQFFATQRQFGVTQNEADSRRLAFMIGDAVNRGGAYARTDEVLTAVEQFTATAARASLTTPNVGGYTDILASLLEQRRPGLDPGGAASLLSRADAGFRGEGGEAALNFRLGAYQRAFGREFSGLDINMASAQGLFSSPLDAFGPGSLARQQADPATRRVYDRLLSHPNAGRSNIDLMLEALRAEYGHLDSRLFRNAGANLLHISEPEFLAVNAASQRPGGLTGLHHRLAGMGVDVSHMPIGNIPILAQLMDTNRAGLSAQAARLISGEGYDAPLDDRTRKQLAQAERGSDGEFRKAVLQLSANRELTDIGERSLDSLKQIETGITALASNFLPMMTSVRDSILSAIGKTPEDLASAQKSWALMGDSRVRDTAIGAARSRMTERQPLINAYRERVVSDRKPGGRGVIPQSEKDREEAYRELQMLEDEQAQDEAIIRSAQGAFEKAERRYDHGAKITPEKSAILDQVAKKHGIDRRYLEKVLLLEGSGPTATSPAGAYGEFQIMPEHWRGGRRPSTFAEGADIAAFLLADAQHRLGDNEDAILADYNGGPRQSGPVSRGLQPPASETRNYLERSHRLDRTLLPPDHRAARSGRVRFDPLRVDGQITVIDQNGAPRAEPVTIRQFSEPRVEDLF